MVGVACCVAVYFVSIYKKFPNPEKLSQASICENLEPTNFINFAGLFLAFLDLGALRDRLYAQYQHDPLVQE